MFEVFTTPENESGAVKAIVENSKILSGVGTLKHKARSVIGDEGVKVLKGILKK
ncbi:hypothetical protein AGMMS49928_27130 [Spirochaetia bacterium]|nr:hypothetical protein AGMMS49928_27130 [Spirochaetia bacterium]